MAWIQTRWLIHIWCHKNKISSLFFWNRNNSLRPSDAFMRRQSRISLVQTMACHLLGAKPLSEPFPEYCQLEYSVKLLKFKHFHSIHSLSSSSLRQHFRLQLPNYKIKTLPSCEISDLEARFCHLRSGHIRQVFRYRLTRYVFAME